jgi:tape measure domain-containing protein
MINLGTLNYTIGADTSLLGRAERRVNQFADNHNRRMTAMSGAAAKLAAALGAVIVGETVRRGVLLADKYNVLEQRIKTATKTTKDWVAVQGEVVRIAKDTGLGLATTVSLFQGLARTGPELGATNRQMLVFTETLAKLGSIGGSSQTQMDAGLLQLTQGLSAGILRAEEWNSVLENTPEIANRIAQGMGLSVGELRKAVLAGTVLSQDVFQSLLKQAPEIAAEFANMPLTIERTSSAFVTSMTTFAGQVDKAFRGTSTIAQMLQKGADLLGQDWSLQLGQIAEYTAQIGEGMREWVKLGAWTAQQGDLANVSWGRLNTALLLGGVVLVGVLAEIPTLLKVGFTMLEGSMAKFILKTESMIDGLKPKFGLLWAYAQDKALDAADAVAKAWAKVAGLAGFAAKEASINAVIMAENAQREKGLNLLKTQIELQGKDDANRLKILDEQTSAKIDAIWKERDAQREADLQAAKERSKLRSQEVNTGVSDSPLGKGAGAAPMNAPALGGGKSSSSGLFKPFASATIEADPEITLLGDKYQTMQQMTTEHLTAMEKLHVAGAAFGLQTQKDYAQQTNESMAWQMQSQLAMAAGHSKAFFAIQKAASIAMALVEAPKAILSSYKWGAGIGGPALGAAFAATAAAATAAQVAQIRGAQFQGAKAFGGEVMAGGTYRVNEQGPELLSVGGEDFLMMGNKGGRVTPNSDLGGKSKGGGVVVNVHNAPGTTAKVQQRETGGGVTLDIIIETVENAISNGISRGGSLLSATLENQYGLNRVAGVNY